MQRPYYFTADSKCVFNASTFSCQQKTSQQHRNLPSLLSYYWKVFFLHWKQASLYYSVKERFLLFHWQTICIVEWLIHSHNDPQFQLVKCKCNQLNPSMTSDDLMICKKLNRRQRAGEAAALRCYEWTRQTRSQTGKQREEGQVKCGRNVTDSWGRHVDPSPHAWFQVSHPPPPFTRGCQASLKETRSVPSGKSYKSGEGGEESASAGRLVKTRVLCCLVLVWGQLHEVWPERGPHGHINCEDWT